MGWDKRMRWVGQVPAGIAMLSHGDARGERRALCHWELPAQPRGVSCARSGQHFFCVPKTLPSASSRSFTAPGWCVAPVSDGVAQLLGVFSQFFIF